MLDNEILKNVKYNMAFAGLNLDESEILLINQFLNNNLTEQEGIEKIKSEILDINN